MRLSSTLKSRASVKICILFLAGFSSCGPVDDIPANTSTGSGYTPPTVGAVSDTAGFYLLGYFTDETNTTNSYFIHQGDDTTTDFSTDCKIATGSTAYTAATDIKCTLEAKEEDLFFNGGTLQFNVPTTMCDYFVVSGYDFDAFESGTGPGFVKVTKDADGNVTASQVCNSYAAGTPPTCAGGASTKAVVAADTGLPACIYDYSSPPYASQFEGGANCCTGSYMMVIDNNGDVDAGTITKWGGKVSNCRAGPSMHEESKQKKDAASGLPYAIQYAVLGVGKNDTYGLKRPIETTFFGYNIHSNLYLANYFDGTEPVPTTNTLNAAHPYYSFTCYDRAFEMKHRIRLMIRSWDENDADNSYAYDTMYAAKSITAATTPWRTNAPLTDTETVSGAYVQDHWDWNTMYLTGDDECTTQVACLGFPATSFFHIGAISDNEYPGVCMLNQSYSGCRSDMP